MEEIIRASAVAVICAVAVVIVKNYVPEYAPFVQIAGVFAVFISFSGVIKEIVSYCENNFSGAALNSGYILILFKVLGIAVTAKFCSEICKDSGNSSLAFALELAAKAAIISMSLPMLKNLADLTAGLLKG